MGDLVALQALPAPWGDDNPRQVAEDLADLLLKTLHLDFIYLCLRGQADGCESEVARTLHHRGSEDEARGIGRALGPWLGLDPANSVPTIPNPVGSGTSRIVVIPLGADGGDGVLVAGSQEASFPSEDSRIILSVGANQATIVLQCHRAGHAQRRLQRERDELLARLQLQFERMPIGCVITDPKLRIIDWNPAAERIFGFRKEEILGKAAYELVPPTSLAYTQGVHQSLASGDMTAHAVNENLTKDGRTIVCQWCNTPLRDADGEVVAILAMAQEVTERQQADEALRQSEARFHATFDSRFQFTGLLDLDGTLIEANRAALEFGGMRRDDVVGRPFWEARWWTTTAETQERLRAAVARAAQGELVRYEVDVRGADDRIVLIDFSLKPLRDEQGRVVQLIPEGRDITERKQAEQALRESEERFRGTFENAAVGIAHVDGEGRFVRVNRTLCDLFGYRRAELLEKTFRAITHPDDQAASLEQFVPLMRGESTSYSLENRYLRSDGSLVWSQVSVSAQRDATGKPAYAIAVFLDVSERKRLEGELRGAKEAAESANRAKDEFLANVSHEIRTPLNAIFGMTEQTLETPLTDDQRNCLETVMSAASNLLSVINDLLDFSKIESGKLELVPVEFSLRTVIDDTLRLLTVRAHGKGLELDCKVRPEVPDALVGDAGRLRQVLLNLVGNAIKFTTEGEVIVEVDMAPSVAARDDVCLQVTVRDTGIGISLEHQEKVFRAFEQEDTSTTRKYGGTGLGLTIAARLVTLLGGTIHVESELGRGSLFAFSARFRRQSVPAALLDARSTSQARLKNLPILIVDGSVTDRCVLEESLLRWQMNPTSVGDGLAALDALWQGAVSGRPYALALLDAQMPDIDGLGLAAKIRQRAEFSSTRIILMSSGEPRLDQARLHELQVAAHLLKPIPQDELMETIHRVIGQVDGNVVPAARPPKAPARYPTSLRILLAEDNEFNTRHVERLLTRRGHVVHIAVDGRKALALLGVEPRLSDFSVQDADAERNDGTSTAAVAHSPLTSRFHLLLLDLHMPELDGYEVIRAIREREETVGGHLPVIALTARSQPDDRERCLAAGMDDYLAKPILAAELLAAIEQFVPARPRRPPERSSRTRQTSSLLASSTLLAACGGEAVGLRELCHDFQTYAPARLAEVRAALRDRDSGRLREAAHKLAGLLSAFSTRAGDSALDLEECAAHGQLDEAQLLARRLETMARELMRQVASLTLNDLLRQP